MVSQFLEFLNELSRFLRELIFSAFGFGAVGMFLAFLICQFIANIRSKLKG